MCCAVANTALKKKFLSAVADSTYKFLLLSPTAILKKIYETEQKQILNKVKIQNSKKSSLAYWSVYGRIENNFFCNVANKKNF